MNIEKKEKERLKKNAKPKVNLTKATPKTKLQPPETSETKLELTTEIKIEPTTEIKLESTSETKIESAHSESQIEIVQVEVDPKLEREIFAEAENNFLEKKVSRPRRKLTAEGNPAPSRPTFRIKAMQERIAEERLADNKKSTDKDSDLRRTLTRAEITGAVISAVMLVYSISTSDKPLFFFSMSLLTHTLRPLIGSFFGKHNRPVQNALRGFSIAIFFGALLFLVI